MFFHVWKPWIQDILFLAGLEKSKIQNNVIFNLCGQINKMPYHLLSPAFWSIWYNYRQKYLSSLFRKSLLSFRAPEAGVHSGYLPDSYRDKKQGPISLSSCLLSILTFPGHNASAWVGRGIAVRPPEQAAGTCCCGVHCMRPGNCSSADPGSSHHGEWNMLDLALKSTESLWTMVILPPGVNVSDKSGVSKSSFSKLQIPLFNTLNSARNNSRKRFRQWNAKLRKVQRFLLIMGSQYHLNSRITWSFFLLKLDIYKIENPQCFSFQELSGKSLLYYR